jgi:aspartate kinase
MKIYKFGGTSVKDASAIKNVAQIISGEPDRLIVVISAMGKTTNKLEDVVRSYFNGDINDALSRVNEIQKYHLSVIRELFPEKKSVIFNEVDNIFKSLRKRIEQEPSLNFDFEYDQIVSFGEQLSTKIVGTWLIFNNSKCKWVDIRHSVRTDETWREAKINYELSGELAIKEFNFANENIYITQGFIGSTTSNLTTTLGREGSDFSAAILANLLNAKSVTIWKDVPGILNADPQYFEASQKLDTMSYREAIELSFYGAKVIHPKTMKPLVEKNIPLYVRSFIDYNSDGTIICKVDHQMEYIPIFILKKDQVLITISPLDFSFMDEESIGKIYTVFARYRMKVSIVQQSAVNFSAAINKPERGFDKLINELEKDFAVKYNSGLELLTIRYYNDEVISEHTRNRDIFVEQRSRRTARFLLKRP